MTITEQAKQVAELLRGLMGSWPLPQEAADVIDGLVDALAERDAKIERLKTMPMKYRRMAFNAQLQDEVAAQRRVLEQALEALQYSLFITVINLTLSGKQPSPQ